MATPANRVPVRLGRGTKANLDTALAAGDLREGEILFATDEDILYVVESQTLVVAGTDLTSASIGDLSDVDVPAPADGQALVWVDANGNWEASTLAVPPSELNDLTDVNAIGAGDQYYGDVGFIVQGDAIADASFNGVAMGSSQDGADGILISNSITKFGGGSLDFATSGFDIVDVAKNSVFDFSQDTHWTYEFWAYSSSVPNLRDFFNLGKTTTPRSFGLRLQNNKLTVLYEDGGLQTKQSDAITWTTDTWHHIAFVRDGNTLRFYFNGAEVLSSNNDLTGSTITAPTTNAAIGGARTTSTPINVYNGYMEGIRLTRNVARYTASTYDLPTALPEVSYPDPPADGQVLTYSTTDAAWIAADPTGGGGTVSEMVDLTDVEYVPTLANDDALILLHGNEASGTTALTSQISSITFASLNTAATTDTISYFGTGCLDTTGARYFEQDSDITTTALGSGDFTVDFWYYFPSTDTSTANQTFCSHMTSQASNISWRLQYRPTDPGVRFQYTTDGSTLQTYDMTLGAALTQDQWYHIAFTREGAQGRLFIDGTEIDNANAPNFGTDAFRVNTSYGMVVGGERGGSNTCRGYIDEFRLCKGTAHYTADFTPPTKEYPDADQPANPGTPQNGQVLIYNGADSSYQPGDVGDAVTFAALSDTDLTTPGDQFIAGATTGEVPFLLTLEDAEDQDQTFTNTGNWSTPSAPTLVGTPTGAQFGVSAAQAATGSRSVYCAPDVGALGLDYSYNSRYDLGSGDFTMEFWHYHTDFNERTANDIISNIAADESTTYEGWRLYKPNGGGLYLYVANPDFGNYITYTFSNNDGVPSDGTWHHYALVRHNGWLRYYLDGVRQNATSPDYDLTDGYAIFIGDRELIPSTGNPLRLFYNNTYSNLEAEGYYDDVRISKFARYTGEFTPPTTVPSTTPGGTVPVGGQVLMFDGTAWRARNADYSSGVRDIIPNKLEDLYDVSTTNAATDEILAWDGSQWAPTPLTLPQQSTDDLSDFQTLQEVAGSDLGTWAGQTGYPSSAGQWDVFEDTNQDILRFNYTNIEAVDRSAEIYNGGVQCNFELSTDGTNWTRYETTRANILSSPVAFIYVTKDTGSDIITNFDLQTVHLRMVTNEPPADGEVAAWNATNSQWERQDASGVRSLLGIGEYLNDTDAGTGGVVSGSIYYNTTTQDYRPKA